jgi:hypothetical protein
MIDLTKDFQEKHHPCYKCFLNICCSERCPKFTIYHIKLQNIIGEHFHTSNIKFQFCLSKLYYLGVSDIEAKDKMLMGTTKPIRALSSKSEMFKMIIRDLLKRF